MNWPLTLLLAALLLRSAVVSAVVAEPPKSDCKIDQLVRSAQRAQGIVPTHEAARHTLIRRLSFDLLGLPPAADEVDTFVNDPDPNAYDRLVDGYLASPHFGERMAQFWLDLARYADSDGYHDDAERVMWPYRDWVIAAFNASKPFDEFTIEQLAGDLLPNPTLEQIIATAFHRNAPTTTEDGANPDEYRVRYAVDRVNTTSTIWLGLTVQCAECHDHKYDAITTEEYYQLFAFFNQTAEQPLYQGKNAPPIIDVPNSSQALQLEQLDREIELRRATLAESGDGEEAASAYASWWRSLSEKHSNQSAPSIAVNEFLFDGEGQVALTNTGARRTPARYRPSQDGTTPRPTPGIVDGALSFSGRGDALDLGQLVEFRKGHGFTLEAWLKYQNAGGALVSKLDRAEGSRGFETRIEKGRVQVRMIDQWPESAIQVSTMASIPGNQWFHLTVTYDGSSRAEGIHIVVDGEPQDLDVQVASGGLLGDLRNTASTIVGGDSDRAHSFHGVVDELRFYKWPQTSSQLAQAPFKKLRRIAERTGPPAGDHDGVLRNFFLNHVYPPTMAISRELDELRFEREMLLQRVPKLRVMQDADERRPTFVLQRGDFRRPGKQVSPGTPAMLSPIDPPASDRPLTRLDLARWLVGPNQTQSARVTVNRLWSRFFGRGIVSTLDDFGTQGAPATHPELLDWLANEFIRHDWDLKSLVRQIVTSATYRQSSSTSRDMWLRDPENRLLARGPRHRLAAETIRDNALKISGLLNLQIGGPSVRPYQPAGLWREMSKGDADQKAYVQSHGPQLYRRGIYTFWKRSIHYPAFSVLDAPSREVCQSSRFVTNTPTQALTLLNDPTFVEAARVFATAILAAAPEFNGRIGFAYRNALGREPNDAELESLTRLHRDARTHFLQANHEAHQLLAVGEYPLELELETDADAIELAAWTMVAHVILTLDETITKE